MLPPVTVSVHAGDVPEQLPSHEERCQPGAGDAVNVTCSPSENTAVHPAVQLVSLYVTVPLPLTKTVTPRRSGMPNSGRPGDRYRRRWCTGWSCTRHRAIGGMSSPVPVRLST